MYNNSVISILKRKDPRPERFPYIYTGYSYENLGSLILKYKALPVAVLSLMTVHVTFVH